MTDFPNPIPSPASEPTVTPAAIGAPSPPSSPALSPSPSPFLTELRWQLPMTEPIAEPELESFAKELQALLQPQQLTRCDRLAKILWARGYRDLGQLRGWLMAEHYTPKPASEFGEEMTWAIARLLQARDRGETVAIWGDFDADGITATAVLWDGLGQFFPKQQQLVYEIPNRLTDSHGLNCAGLERLRNQHQVSLIVTCDTGSTNIEELNYARTLGIDVIVTDHHTLPPDRPPVTAIINPRYLPLEHPLYTLSGVAVAYKLVEALYAALPGVAVDPLEELLELVAIGLIADLVELRGDARYLAKVGIKRLETHKDEETSKRPGIAALLAYCKRQGDRATDISFGIGPRINAVSRMQGDASFCVELLTSRDNERCKTLATTAEDANSRRKALQLRVIEQVRERLDQLDLSTMQIIVLEDSRWAAGVLGLAAGQIAQEYGRPTILLSRDQDNPLADPATVYARGSARSAGGIDLYQLVNSQAHLLHRFGGHPFAAGLSLTLANLPLFKAGLEHQILQQQDQLRTPPVLQADLQVTVSDLNRDLFRELKQLEPCGMGNIPARLLIHNCWFTDIQNNQLQDTKKKEVQYIRTLFRLWDDSIPKPSKDQSQCIEYELGSSAIKPQAQPVHGVWWGHSKTEIPNCPCDVIVELEFNSNPPYKRNEDPPEKRYEVRIIAVRPTQRIMNPVPVSVPFTLLDWRDQLLNQGNNDIQRTDRIKHPNIKIIDRCPYSWKDFCHQIKQAQAQQTQADLSELSLALAYPAPNYSEPETFPETVLRKWLGLGKYLVRTGLKIQRKDLAEKFEFNQTLFNHGIQIWKLFGFQVVEVYESEIKAKSIRITDLQPTFDEAQKKSAIADFLDAMREVQFSRQYFATATVEELQANLEILVNVA